MAGLFMAALREAFEECGVLAAQDQQGPSLAAQLRASASPGGWQRA